MKSTLQIQNLKCHGCANTIMTQLSKLVGVSEILVNNDSNQVSFHYNSEAEFSIVKKKLSDLGYPVEGEANPLPKKAKSFISCAVGRLTK